MEAWLGAPIKKSYNQQPLGSSGTKAWLPWLYWRGEHHAQSREGQEEWCLSLEYVQEHQERLTWLCDAEYTKLRGGKFRSYTWVWNTSSEN